MDKVFVFPPGLSNKQKVNLKQILALQSSTKQLAEQLKTESSSGRRDRFAKQLTRAEAELKCLTSTVLS